MQFRTLVAVGLAAVLAAALLLANWSGGATRATTVKEPPVAMEITTSRMRYDYTELTFKLGQTVRLTLDNQDTVIHDFVIDKIPGTLVEVDPGAARDLARRHPDFRLAADPGKRSTVEFTPTQAGTYEFYCTVPIHKDVGMVGTLSVR